jgi:glycerol uptake facilitator-like aquaporin
MFMGMYEFFGMILFLVGINCSQNDASVAALGLFVAATLTGRLSGGHFNMAITFAVYVVEGKFRQNFTVAAAIAIIDIFAAFVAMVISIGMLGSENTFTLIPPSQRGNFSFTNLGYLLVVEAFFTMIFVSTVLFVKYRRVSATTDGMLSNLTVAIALYMCVRMAGPLSGGGLNPSIAIAIIITDSISYMIDPNSSNDGQLAFLPAYILGPLLGGFMAAMLLRLSVKISNETEGATEDDSTVQPKYEIGQSNSTI